MVITGAIFDADGTLFDSMHVWENLGDDYLRSKGVDTTEEYRNKIKKMFLTQAIKYIVENYPVSASEEVVLEEMLAITEKAYSTEVKSKVGVADFLDFFAKKGVKMCIATSAERKMIESALENNDLSRYFDFIVTSSEVGIGKSSPDIYNKALERLNTDKLTTIIFEDSAYAAETAKKAGFTVCGVYDKFEKNQEKLAENSDMFIKTYIDAVKMFD